MSVGGGDEYCSMVWMFFSFAAFQGIFGVRGRLYTTIQRAKIGKFQLACLENPMLCCGLSFAQLGGRRIGIEHSAASSDRETKGCHGKVGPAAHATQRFACRT